MSNKTRSSPEVHWPEIIQSVQSPLGFFTLVVLVTNGILGILAYRADPPERTWLIIVIVVILIVLILIVTTLAIVRPQALKGSSISLPFDSTKPEVAAKIREIAKNEAINTELVDPKLVHFIPPLNPIQFKIISFHHDFAPQYFNWPFVPTGAFVVYGVPFFLLPVTDSNGSMIGHVVLDSQPGAYNEPSIRKVEAPVEEAKNVHFLISAGHGYRMYDKVQFLYKRIGYLRFIYKDGTDQRTDLILGKHLREWAFGNSPNLVTELDPAWSKPAWLSHDNTRRFDTLSVPISGSPKYLSMIEIVSEFEQNHPDNAYKTPSIIISAITVERNVSS